MYHRGAESPHRVCRSRVIEQTIKQQLPDQFQRAEFLLEHGMIDMIVERKQLKETLSTLVAHF